MEFMTWVIIWIVIASFISWYLISKEIDEMNARNERLSACMMKNYEANLLRREEAIYTRVYKSIIEKEHPEIVEKLKNA